MTDRRNQEVKDIGRLLGFPYEDPVKGRDPWTPNLKPEAERPLNSLGIFDSQCVLFFSSFGERRLLMGSLASQSIDLAGRFECWFYPLFPL